MIGPGDTQCASYYTFSVDFIIILKHVYIAIIKIAACPCINHVNCC